MDRVEELNNRLHDRNRTSTTPQMLFSPRPISIKYNDFPAVDHYRPTSVPMIPYSNYNIRDDYLPTSYISPLNGYNVNSETDLRNLNEKLSKCPSIYMPKYTTPHVVGRKEVNPHPLLNTSVKMVGIPQNTPKTFNMFNNTTRAKNS
jgi:hypothetical protein